MSNMLLVGSTARNNGKTTFCFAFVKKWKDACDITGLKVTTVREGKGVCHHGNDGCGACSSFSGGYDISEETLDSGEKDTNMLLAAGAKRVFWIRTTAECAGEALGAVMPELPSNGLIVCESNVLAGLVKPGVIVLMHRAGIEDVKPSAGLLIEKADFVCDISKPGSTEAALDGITVSRVDGRVCVGKLVPKSHSKNEK